MSDAFDKAFIQGANTGAAASMEAIKERIKSNDEQRQSSAIFDLIHQKIAGEAVKSGKTPEEVDALSKKFDKLSKIGFSPTEALGIGKMVAPDVFQDETAKAIKDQTLFQKETQNAMTRMPEGLVPLTKDSTPDEKAQFLDKLPPELATNVQAVANYDLDATKVSSMRTSERATLLAAVKMYKPEFDMKKYPAQQDYIKQLSRTENGTVGSKVNSINTLVAHLDLMDQQIDKLKNTNLKPQNAVVNLAKDLTGDTTITDFKQAKAVVDSEMETLLTNVGATQQGLEARRALLSDNAGYDQMKSSIRTIGHILQARAKPFEQQYTQLFDKDPGDTILHSDSRNTLKRLYSSGDSSKKSYAGLWS